MWKVNLRPQSLRPLRPLYKREKENPFFFFYRVQCYVIGVATKDSVKLPITAPKTCSVIGVATEDFVKSLAMIKKTQ